jgi:hypothetical protein
MCSTLTLRYLACTAGDLTSNNVLLAEDKTDPRGFKTKVRPCTLCFLAVQHQLPVSACTVYEASGCCVKCGPGNNAGNEGDVGTAA